MTSKKLYTVVLIIAGAAITGLLIAQMIWYGDAFKLREGQFDDKVFVLLNQAVITMGENPELKARLENRLNDFIESRNLRDRDSEDVIKMGNIEKVIDSVFQANGIATTFHFGIFQSEDCSNRQFLISSDLVSGVDESEYQSPISLACILSEEYAPFYLSIAFPQKKKYILSQSWGMLGLSLLLIIALLATFAYMIHLFKKQKKISQIKNDFINNLTHEFKTPVASIALASKVIQKNKNKVIGQEEMNYLRLITDESKRLENNIDKVLQIATVDSEVFALDVENLNIHHLIRDVVSDFTLRINEKKGRINLHLKALKPVIKADNSHLRNLFYNLIDNAIKYSDKPPEIAIITEDKSDGFCFRIRDNGIGIDSENQSQVFEKFYRASSGDTQRVKGFGLGLSYVKSIVDAHKGSILFKTILHQGTEFTVLLPSR